MRTLTITAAILAATISTASASCGGEWSFGLDVDETDMDRNTYNMSMPANTTFDDRNEYSVGIRFTMPFGDDDCDLVRAKASKERDQARKAKAEADYAERRAAKENEFAVSKRIDNLQRIIVTCESHSNLPICDKIDEMSMELFN